MAVNTSIGNGFRGFLASIGLGIAGTALAAAPAQHGGVEAGFTAEGYPYLGAASAPLVLEEWSDYQCPFCARHFQRTVPELLDRYVRAGKMKIVFRDFPIESLHPTSAIGHAAAACAGRQGAGAYWSMHDALFQQQGQWSRPADPQQALLVMAGALGLDAELVKACLAEGKEMARVEASIAEGQALGFNGTPMFRFQVTETGTSHSLSGAHPFERFAGIADALLAGEQPPEPPAPPVPELPLWAKPEGLAPDPARPGYTVAGDAYKGNPSAKVVVVEFEDFQCPACRTHVLEVQPKIDAELVDTGKVLWVSKHLPLQSHAHAALAAAAAECAGDQGKYWSMHALLYQTVEEWAVEEAESRLLNLAPRAGLEASAFKSCLSGRRALERVLKDLYDAQGVVDRVPRFAILGGAGPGTLTGGLSAVQFVELLKGRLESSANAMPPAEPGPQPAGAETKQ